MKTIKNMRDGLSGLASRRNVQCFAGAINCVYSRAQNHVNLSCLRSGNFYERSKKINEKILRKMKMYLWQKLEVVILQDGNLDSKKRRPHRRARSPKKLYRNARNLNESDALGCNKQYQYSPLKSMLDS